MTPLCSNSKLEKHKYSKACFFLPLSNPFLPYNLKKKFFHTRAYQATFMLLPGPEQYFSFFLVPDYF